MSEELRSELLRAITNCPHKITSATVVLQYDGSKPGNNVLDQLCTRIESEVARRLSATAAEPIGEVVVGEGDTKGWTVVKWRADAAPIAVGTKLYATPQAAAEPAKAEPAQWQYRYASKWTSIVEWSEWGNVEKKVAERFLAEAGSSKRFIYEVRALYDHPSEPVRLEPATAEPAERWVRVEGNRLVDCDITDRGAVLARPMPYGGDGSENGYTDYCGAPPAAQAPRQQGE